MAGGGEPSSSEVRGEQLNCGIIPCQGGGEASSSEVRSEQLNCGIITCLGGSSEVRGEQLKL